LPGAPIDEVEENSVTVDTDSEDAFEPELLRKNAKVSIKSAKQDMRQRDSCIAGEVSPSRAYGPPLVAVIPGGEGPTDQVQYNRIQGIRYNTGPSAIVSRRYGLPSSQSDAKS
jgi:hypothetical protein